MTHPLIALSDAIADHAAATAPGLVTLHPGTRAQRTAFAWADGLVATSEQALPHAAEHPVLLPGGAEAVATLAGRDTGTNVALLRLDLKAPALTDAAPPRTGALALAVGAEHGAPTVAWGVVHRAGPAWDSMAGGRIDALIRLDLRLATASEGGPVLDASGALIGMSTFGPRRRILVIPAATIRRVLPALQDGASPRGWLGVGLQPVGLPAGLHQAAGRDAALMVVSVAAQGPADHAGMLPGDILLDVDGAPAKHPRDVARALAHHAVGAAVPLRLLRAGLPLALNITLAPRPAA